MRRSTLATSALVAVFISYLGTPAAVKTGGYVATDLVVNKSPLTDKNGIVHRGTVGSKSAEILGVSPKLQPARPSGFRTMPPEKSTLYNVPG